MLKEKRELFRVQIRRQKNEEIFTKKRLQIQNNNLIDFPHTSLEQLLLKQNISQSLEILDTYLTSKQEIDPQSINKLIQVGKLAFEIMPYYPQESSKFLTNLTFHMKRDQLIFLLSNCQFVNLLNLLNHSSDDLKDNFSKIIINILVDLEQGEFNNFAENLMLINNIYYSYTTHGANRDLSFTYLKILASLFCANYKESNIEQVLEMIDNICQAASDDKLKLQSFKTMRAAIASPHIKQLEIVEQVDKFLIIDDCLSAIQNMMQEKKISQLGIQALKLLNVMLEKNKLIMKLLLENYHLLIHYSNAIQNEFVFEYPQILEQIYRGLCFIIDDDNNYAIKEQEFCFEILVKHVQSANKENEQFPPSISKLINSLLKSRYKEQTIIEFPIFKIVNEHYQNLQFPLKIEEYLQIVLTVLQIGETIYPERYVGEFILHQGEQVIQDIQKNTNDYNNMQMVEQILKMAEYDENDYEF